MKEKEEWICLVLEVLVEEVTAAPVALMAVMAAREAPTAVLVAVTWDIARLRPGWVASAAGDTDPGGPWAAAVVSAPWSLPWWA